MEYTQLELDEMERLDQIKGPERRPAFMEFFARVEERRLGDALSVTVRIKDRKALAAWEAQRKSVGWTRSHAVRFGWDFLAPAIKEWRSALVGSSHFPIRWVEFHLDDHDCAYADDEIVHGVSSQGRCLAVVLVGTRLVTRDCGVTLTWKEYDAELERRADEYEAKLARGKAPSPERVEEAREMILASSERMWRSGRPAPESPRTPTTEERRAKRLEKLRIEAKRLGVELVEPDAEPAKMA